MKATISAKDSTNGCGAQPIRRWPEINPAPAVWESGAMTGRRPGAMEALYCLRKMDLTEQGLQPPW